jgi:hypothetical protein
VLRTENPVSSSFGSRRIHTPALTSLRPAKNTRLWDNRGCSPEADKKRRGSGTQPTPTHPSPLSFPTSITFAARGFAFRCST